jgi:hypothetical protein
MMHVTVNVNVSAPVSVHAAAAAKCRDEWAAADGLLGEERTTAATVANIQ